MCFKLKMYPILKTYPTNLATQFREIPKFEGSLIRTMPTAEEILAKQLRETEKLEREQELLVKQMALPPDLRNKELLAKYKMTADPGIINGYKPERDGTGKEMFYHYRCYFPVNPEIAFENRPSGSYNVELNGLTSSRGDKFSFFFPISRANFNAETGIAFKLDNFDTYLDEDKNWIATEGVFDIFPALLLFKKEEKAKAHQILDIFHRYNILESLTSADDLWKPSTQLDFRIKNKGISVSATAIVAPEPAAAPTDTVGVSTKLDETAQIIRSGELKLTSKQRKFWFFDADQDTTPQLEDLDGDVTLRDVYCSIGRGTIFRVRIPDDRYDVISGSSKSVSVDKLKEAIAIHNAKAVVSEVTDQIILKVMKAKNKK